MQTTATVARISTTGGVRYITIKGDTIDELKSSAYDQLNPDERCMFVVNGRVYNVVCSKEN